MTAFFERGFEVWSLRFPDPEPHILVQEDLLKDSGYRSYIAELRKKVLQTFDCHLDWDYLPDAYHSGSRTRCVGMPLSSPRQGRMAQRR